MSFPIQKLPSGPMWEVASFLSGPDCARLKTAMRMPLREEPKQVRRAVQSSRTITGLVKAAPLSEGATFDRAHIVASALAAANAATQSLAMGAVALGGAALIDWAVYEDRKTPLLPHVGGSVCRKFDYAIRVFYPIVFCCSAAATAPLPLVVAGVAASLYNFYRYCTRT